MSIFSNDVAAVKELRNDKSGAWSAINPEYVARMRLQNRFKTGLDIARYTAGIMRADMAEYDTDHSA
jgi:isocitrate lyase